MAGLPTGRMSTLFRTKSIAALIAASDHPSHRLKKTLGLGSLIALGIGMVVGSGIFTLTGTAAAGLKFDYPSILKAPLLNLLISGKDAVGTFGRPGAGPAISISFLLVGLACSFAALCYAELASMIPVSGSAYTYAYATMGEIVAWIIGWDLILEYAVGNMAVAVGFGAYFNDLLDNVFGFHLPFQLTQPIFIEGKPTGAWFNLPSFLLVMLITWLLVRGVRESARANGIIVTVKVGAILLFIFGAARSVDAHNWHPFMPNGYSGVLTGAAIVFFSYIGFDALSTTSEECHDPQRDLPRGILYTLVICAILYAAVALVLTGIVHWDTLSNDAPVANALKAVGLNRLRFVVTVGALLGMISSILVGQYGQSRILFAMSRDRLLPGMFCRVHPKFETPDV
ncbi:MAG TPA: amino acid permease, partial [Tepidisphaeraceae bacterium]|nr:amino acid permease [Tepidisphaeraceae bacterium]